MRRNAPEVELQRLLAGGQCPFELALARKRRRPRIPCLRTLDLLEVRQGFIKAPQADQSET